MENKGFLEQIADDLKQVWKTVSDAGQAGHLSELDRDIVLERFRSIYARLKEADAVRTEPAKIPVPKPQPLPEPKSQSVGEVPKPTPAVSVDPKEEPAEKSPFQSEAALPFDLPAKTGSEAPMPVAPEDRPREPIRPVTEKPTAAPVLSQPIQAAQAADPFRAKPIGRDVIDSLYGDGPNDEPAPKQKMEPAVPAPVAAAPAQPVAQKVLGEVIGNGGVSLNETIAPEKKADIAAKLSAQAVTDIRRSIGLNDRFLLIRDLFAGNAAEYDRVLGELNSLSDIDEAFIYLQENLVLDPNSEAVKLLVDLVNRKHS
jgi:hypothetical protein